MSDMQAPAAPIDQLYLTALPNGRDGKTLRLSLLLTPSLITKPVQPPFVDWPTYAQNLAWTLTFADSAHNPIGASIDLTIDPDSLKGQIDWGKRSKLWGEIFRHATDVKPRTGHNKLHRTWRLSHDVTNLHRRHELYRLSHAYSQIAANNGIGSMSGNIAQAQSDMKPPVLFLHPEYSSGDLTIRYDDRARVQTQLDAIVAALPKGPPKNFSAIVAKRTAYGIKKLEEYGGAKLSAAALSALYVSCLQSADAAGKVDAALAAAIVTINAWFPTGALIQAQYPTLDKLADYVHMLLFHRRAKMMKPDHPQPVTPPDFHQLLGLVHNHPAIMRPLALVWDFVVPVPAAAMPAPFCIKIEPKTPLSIKTVPWYTQCTLTADNFFATPKAGSPIADGMLNLQVKGSGSDQRFTLVPENADSQALKLTDQSNNAARSTEYSSSASTAMNVSDQQPQAAGAMLSTPSSRANPTTASPAPRTVGLALFDQDRLKDLEKTASQTAETPDGTAPVPAADFFADDLVLGYRVDVLYKQNFTSLCVRGSQYNIFTPFSNLQVDTWSPSTPNEIAADEGFISFAATQSPLQDNGTAGDPAETQTQVHQSIFTWTGWSLSVPAPLFPSINPIPTSDRTESKANALRPTYVLPKGHKLPPLRFNLDYKIRCRVVDLAGNGLTPGIDPYNLKYFTNTIAPVTPFSRHEPIRAPQFLLREAIDHVDEPGTHIDRMVARDNDRESVRILVPPRESLRLAELSGYLNSDRLPPSSFANQQLLEDGSFPSVACAKDKDWIDGDIVNPGDNDPIFLEDRGNIDVKNPYYPDPLANFIRIEIFELTDDPAKSSLVDLVWIRITEKKREWSERLPVRVRLKPSESLGSPTVALDLHSSAGDDYGIDSLPTLDVTLPKGSTAVLRISSAAVEGGAAGADSPEYPMHLSHLTRMHLQHPTALTALVRGATAPGAKSFASLALAAATDHAALFQSSHTFVDGSLDVTTPKRTMTLVHAVKKPLDPPAFAPVGSAEYLQVIRNAGKPEANISGALRAHWLSTSKITCYAEWTDNVDDVTQPACRPVKHREVAFVATAKELVRDAPFPVDRLRSLSGGLVHHLLDTRAHEITYKLVATGNFREYYPGADIADKNEKEYQRAGDLKGALITVASSARPVAPDILYLIPAFVWANTWDHDQKKAYTGRTIIVRAYHGRPFLLSGNNETLGVVLSDPNSGVAPADQNFVSRWGADPTRTITTPILRNELTEDNLCEPGPEIETCVLAEGGTARVKPCAIQYSHERQLWFTDIPINTQHANAPFVRLALVRWQPDALSVTTEARCSQVVFAEFMQIAPDRWVSIQKKSGAKNTYTITISGAFIPGIVGNDPPQCFTFELYKRWYALGSDTGWRKIDCTYAFRYQKATDDSGVSSWTTDFDIRHSVYAAKYRVLLSEQEFPGVDNRKSFSVFIDLP
jgi:hypothetical protein